MSFSETLEKIKVALVLSSGLALRGAAEGVSTLACGDRGRCRPEAGRWNTHSIACRTCHLCTRNEKIGEP